MKKLNISSDKILDEYFLKSFQGKPKIAIIGNAGITDEDQEAIDEANIVIRFNNFATRENIRHSKNPYRCDILFTTFDLHSRNAKIKDVVVGIPYPFKHARIIEKFPQWYPTARQWMVNPYENYRLCQELGLDSDGYAHPLPSLGFTALWHLQDFDASIYIGGFEWYVNTDEKLIQKRKITDPLPTHFNHYYLKEVQWILKNLRPKLNVKFSARCNQILDLVQSELKA